MLCLVCYNYSCRHGILKLILALSVCFCLVCYNYRCRHGILKLHAPKDEDLRVQNSSIVKCPVRLTRTVETLCANVCGLVLPRSIYECGKSTDDV